MLAVPPIITNAYLGVDEVDADLVDAARGMGMSAGEILARVELPLALPLIFAGIRTAALFVISTATIASLAGFSGTLGDLIANETSYHFSGVLGAAICVAALALAVEGALALLQRALTPRGLRSGRSTTPPAARSASLRRSRLDSVFYDNHDRQTRNWPRETTLMISRLSRHRTLSTRVGALAAACALSLALAACGSSSKSSSSSSSTSTTAATVVVIKPATSGPGVGKPAVTIGDKNFAEEYILGQLYTQALKAKGFTSTSTKTSAPRRSSSRR